VVSILQRSEELRLYILWFRNGHFKPRLESGIFKCISWLNGSFFGGEDQSFLKQGVKTYLMAPTSPLNYLTSFLS
jgi:hypothetical protein